MILLRFMECRDRNNRSAIMLPYFFLPSMAAKTLRQAAEKQQRHGLVMATARLGRW